MLKDTGGHIQFMSFASLPPLPPSSLLLLQTTLKVENLAAEEPLLFGAGVTLVADRDLGDDADAAAAAAAGQESPEWDWLTSRARRRFWNWATRRRDIVEG